MSIMLCSIIPVTAFAEELPSDPEQTAAESEVNTDVLDVEEVRQVVEYNIQLSEPITTIQITEEDYNNQAVPLVEGSAYQGSFNSTALNYFTGVMMNNIGSDYVAFRSSQYVYYLFYGDDISYNGVFTGSDLNYVSYNSQYGTLSRGVDNLDINPNSTIVYSNIDESFAHIVEVKNVEETRVNSILIASCMLMLLFFWIWKR